MAARGRVRVASVLDWRSELSGLQARLGELFVRSEPRRQAGLYLEGLLSAVERKNGWQLAEHLGDARPWRTQRLLSHVQWDEAAARDLCRAYVVETLADREAVLIVDETGFLKKGTKSAGVARQYSGTAGRIENCQIGVFLAYAGGNGHALIDRELYLPKEWAEDPARRKAAGIPQEVAFATKPELARRMIARAIAAEVPFAWVLGEEVYGSDRRLRIDLEQQERPFVLAIRSNEKLWSTLADRIGQYTAAALAAAVPEEAWQRLSAGAGAKGERFYDWARVRLMRLQQPPWDHWLLVRRHPSKPDKLAYYVVRPGGHQPGHARPRRRTALSYRGVLRGRQAGGRLGGLRDPFPARLVPAHHPGHAGAGLSRGAALHPKTRRRSRDDERQKGAARARPLVDLSTNEIRHLISRLQQLAGLRLGHVLAWSLWRRLHQAAAKICHWKRRCHGTPPDLHTQL